MIDWKKILKNGLIVLLLVLLGVEVYMEIHFSCDEISRVSTNTEAILRRVPEAVITEEDRALLTELLEVPSVRELLESGENGSITAAEDTDVADAAGKYLNGEGAGSLYVSVLFLEDETFTALGWQEGKRSFYLQPLPEETGMECYKLYSPKRGTAYENWDNERAQKSQSHRRWFAWLRDRMWEDED